MKDINGREFHVGDRIRIIDVDATATFNDGIDTAALAMQGQTGTIEYIGGEQLHGTWGGLAVIPACDKIEIIS